MEFKERLEIARQILKAKGLSRAAGSSLPHLLLWRLGIPVPLPYFSSFGVNLAVSGLWFAPTYGGVMWLMFWRHGDTTISSAIVGSAIGGAIYGIFTAMLALRAKQKHGLPNWDDLERPSDIFD